ncbi:hypothetical protein LQG66_05355 [Bradyrhizobium ontarionense]|uniref:Transcriptional regulator n=1 Tax=Bradyrhizobium ontarionense TaxID=2898149 RepID=A0ABY3RFF6_9BRAD|nr:hypothetical protein [Bradyrhizobium sp. A19]UFZ05742.1 hypothetical protein LQG66_05355 [Bradyrhizobium sp. A19]
MPVQTTPKEVDPGDVALSPDDDICEEIYQRVLGEVRARIDQRIADIEAKAAATELVEVDEPATDSAEQTAVPRAPRRRPVLRAAITLVASAGLAGAVVTLARDHTQAITSVTDRIDAAIQSVRENLPKTASTREPETAMSGSSSSEAVLVAPASPSPSPSSAALPPLPLPDATPAPSSDPSSAMAEATPERDVSSAPERDLVPLIEKIAHDVAGLQAGLQDLKASQEQTSRDHTKAIEQLQASQDQLARAVRAAKNETTVGAAARLAPRPPQARPPRFP